MKEIIKPFIWQGESPTVPLKERIDYRVRLDFVYIPKNAYESNTFFRIVDKCANWISPAGLNSLLLRTRFWEKQEVYKTKQKPSSESDRGTVEVVRDILDLAVYIGLLDKRHGYGEKGRGYTEFRLTRRGQQVCKGVFERDPSVQIQLIEGLLSYRIPNAEIDIGKYIQYQHFSARPFFVLLKLLYDFEDQVWRLRKNPRFHPKELAYVVLSVGRETQSEFHKALDRMLDLALHGQTVTNDFSLLEKYLTHDNYTLKEFDAKTNNLVTRLFRWPYVLGLLDCKTNLPDGTSLDMFSKLAGIRIRDKVQAPRVFEIYGLTRMGRDIIRPYLDTVYIFSGLTNTEKLLSIALSMAGRSVVLDNLADAMKSQRLISDKADLIRSLERLRSRQLIELTDSSIKVTRRPVFDSVTEVESDEILRRIKQILIKLGIKPTGELGYLPSVRSIIFDQSQYVRKELDVAKLLEDRDMKALTELGIDPQLHDYPLLAVGDPKLSSVYTDPRRVFETKTELIFRQMAFRTQHYGQNVKRGESSPDITALWERVVKGVHTTHITIIECKSSGDPYNISLTDVDDRIRQIRNLIDTEDYKTKGLKAFIDSLMFVSSQFGMGNNRGKLIDLRERCRQDLKLNVATGAISAIDLLRLYASYRRDPIRFMDYNFLDLLHDNIVTINDINAIFN